MEASGRPAAARTILAAVAAVGVLAAGAAVVLGRARPPQSRPASSRPASAPAPATYGVRAAFVVGGARFSVVANPRQGWTTFRHTYPGRGRQWLAVTILVRNLTMPAFDPRVLDYRIFDGSGTAFAPVGTIGSGPARARPAHPVAPGRLVEARLGFRLNRPATGLVLRFSPVPGGAPILVSLGP